MRADAPGKGGCDAAMVNVELSVADLCLGIIDGSLRGLQVGRADALSSCAVAWASLIS
jgi:hypothetical protein